MAKTGLNFFTPSSCVVDTVNHDAPFKVVHEIGMKTQGLAFYSEEYKRKLYNDLLLAYIALSIKFKEEMSLKRSECLSDLKKDLRLCATLLQKINYAMLIAVSSDKTADDYCDSGIVQCLNETFHEINNNKSKFIKKWMGMLNERRLYWVWGGGLLSEVLEQFPDDFYHVAQAKKTTSTPSPYLGGLGWSLYYARFLLELSLLLKNTIDGPWLSKDEAQKTWIERFKTQWRDRKFQLINDAVWASANLICFFWWFGPGFKGHAGDLLTIGLLLMDLCLSIWKYIEAQAEHKEELEKLEALRENACKSGQSHEAIDQAIKKCQTDWYFQKIAMINDIAYSAALLAAFSLMTVPFLPVAASLAMTLGIVGMAACFALTVIYSAISSGIEIAKTLKAKKDISLQVKELEELFNKTLDQTLDLNQLKEIYSSITDLKALNQYHNKMLRYQALSLTRAVLIDAIMPALVFAATVFLPLGTGFAVIGLALGLAVLSKFLLEKFAKPEDTEKSKFEEHQWSLFSHKQKQMPVSRSSINDDLCDSRDSLLSTRLNVYPDEVKQFASLS